jgi:hypothetical protein
MVLGRHACLGYDVLSILKIYQQVNFPKDHSDLLLSYWGDKSLLQSSLCSLMARKDVLPLIRHWNAVTRRAPNLSLWILLPSLPINYLSIENLDQ